LSYVYLQTFRNEKLYNELCILHSQNNSDRTHESKRLYANVKQLKREFNEDSNRLCQFTFIEFLLPALFPV